MSTDRKRDNRNHYLANKEKYLARNVARRNKIRDWLQEQKCKPCTDCGNAFHFAAMDFDHVGTKKNFNLAEAASRSMGLKRIQSEIAKCELVCAVCHRIRTFKRSQACTS